MRKIVQQPAAKKILPALVLLGAAMIGWSLLEEPPAVVTKTAAREAPWVDVIAASPKTLQLNVVSQGIVSARTEIDLVPEVAGKVVSVHPAFAVGGFFKAGEKLIGIAPQDYEFAVTRAQAKVAEARKELLREQAEAEQAKQEWQELGSGQASPFVLRQPHLQERQAKLASSLADLQEARLMRERCDLRAPFDGRVRRKNVDVGQYVESGDKLARLYATDVVEIRLPLPPNQLAFVELPFNYPEHATDATEQHFPGVTLTANFGNRPVTWQGKIVRSEGELDEKTGMLYAIAQVTDPFAYDPKRPPLALGQFVRAEIEGIAAEKLIKIPTQALRSGYQVFVVDRDDRLRLRTVEVVRREDDGIIVSGGIDSNARLLLSGIELPVEGMRVRVKPDLASADKTSDPRRN